MISVSMHKIHVPVKYPSVACEKKGFFLGKKNI